MAQDKMRKMIWDKKVEHKFTGKEIYEKLNNTDNYNLSSELFGKAETAKIFEASKSLNKKAITKQRITKAVGTVATAKWIKILLTPTP